MLKKLSGFNLGEFFAIKVAPELPLKFLQMHPSISRKKLISPFFRIWIRIRMCRLLPIAITFFFTCLKHTLNVDGFGLFFASQIPIKEFGTRYCIRRNYVCTFSSHLKVDVNPSKIHKVNFDLAAIHVKDTSK